jgi:hypothetical protein
MSTSYETTSCTELNEAPSGLTVVGQVIVGNQVRLNKMAGVKGKWIYERGYGCTAESHPGEVWWCSKADVTKEMRAAFEANEYDLPDKFFLDYELLIQQLKTKQQPNEGYNHAIYNQIGVVQPPALQFDALVRKLADEWLAAAQDGEEAPGLNDKELNDVEAFLMAPLTPLSGMDVEEVGSLLDYESTPGRGTPTSQAASDRMQCTPSPERVLLSPQLSSAQRAHFSPRRHQTEVLPQLVSLARCGFDQAFLLQHKDVDNLVNDLLEGAAADGAPDGEQDERCRSTAPVPVGSCCSSCL